MNEVVGISTQVQNNRDMKFNEVFSKIIIDVPPKKYYKSHLFSKNELNSKFKEYLYLVNDVTRIEELLQKFGEGWTLKIVPGEGDYNKECKDKIFTLYYDDYEKFYSDKKQIRDSAKAVSDLFNLEKKPNSKQISRIIEKISERSNELCLSEQEKISISNSIPNILMNNNIKLKKDDVFDINKIAIQDVIAVGRGILNKDNKVLKYINAKDINREDAWQKYFEKYGNYLLFGNVRLNPKECLDKEKTKDLNNKYPDLITCNRYGFLDIIELKKSDEYLFKFDDSHNNLVPSPALSSAISQLNNYLQIIPYAYTEEDAQNKGLQCASGMLMIGDKKHLVKDSKHLREFMDENNLTEDYLSFWAQKELRKLNYSYSYIQVILYDELINTLENFINKIS